MAEQPVLLRAEDLRKAFGGQTVLDGVSLELQRGEVVLLRGANGSGKTTLLNILTGNLEPDAGSIQLFTNGMAEYFRFPRRWWHDLNPFDHFLPERVAEEGVGRTWQEIRLFSTQSLVDNIAVATPGQLGENPAWTLLRRRAVREEEQENRDAAATMLAGLGLEGRETSSADKVSLGQSKRVAIARAVRAGARILFLDEPLAGLDAPGIAAVMDLLEQLAREAQITLVVVEHIFNIPRVLDLADTVWTLDQGTLSVEDPADVRATLTYAHRNAVRDRMLDVARQDAESVDHPLHDGALLSIITPAASVPGEAVLEVEDLVVYRGPRLVIGMEATDGTVRGLSFTLRRNQLAVLQAPNGWGKTTLLEAIAGTLPIAQGTIRLNGQPIQNLPAWKRDISLLQARDHVFPSLSVHEALQLAQVERVSDYVKPLLRKQVSDLSGGEKQKVALACATEGKKSAVVLLDEAFSALEERAVHHLLEWIISSSEVSVFLALPSMREQNTEVGR